MRRLDAVPVLADRPLEPSTAGVPRGLDVQHDATAVGVEPGLRRTVVQMEQAQFALLATVEQGLCGAAGVDRAPHLVDSLLLLQRDDRAVADRRDELCVGLLSDGRATVALWCDRDLGAVELRRQDRAVHRRAQRLRLRLLPVLQLVQRVGRSARQQGTDGAAS